MDDASVNPTQAPIFRARAEGVAAAWFAPTGRGTEAARFREAGGLRLRFPRSTEVCETVIVNTGGGMAGGDRADLAFEAASAASAMVTTQSAEKIYRSDGETTLVAAKLRVEAGGALEWLPQETILFDGAKLKRRLDVDVIGDGRLLLVETLVFGRLAFGETHADFNLADDWRVRRDGRLLFAEALRLDGARTLDRPAIGAGARAATTLLVVGAEPDGALDAVREALAVDLADSLDAGASVVEGIVVARIAARDPRQLRTALDRAMLRLRGRARPRVWN